MKVLLLGEYSNVHWTLAQGLRALGHDVTVVSDGDGWKDYPRDIDLRRRSRSKWGGLLYYIQAKALRLRGYDVVQLINPVFLDLRAERMMAFYERLRRDNGRMFLGAFGMDHYWVRAGLDCRTFRYSDFNLGSQVRQSADNTTWINDWLHGPKGKLNQYIARDCDGIVSGLYEYDASYRPYFADKLRFIPFPIDRTSIQPVAPATWDRARFFVGVQRLRSAYKGTDIMLRALERLQTDLPGRFDVVKVESVPYAQYQALMNSCNIMLDQLYSYTPAMNALLGMAKGLIIVGGGEPENYEILGERELRPIVNVLPDEQSVYDALRRLAEQPGRIRDLSRQSVEYIARHHDHIRVAQRYVDFWTAS